LRSQRPCRHQGRPHEIAPRHSLASLSRLVILVFHPAPGPRFQTHQK
jgi:hypothetical protein